MRNYWVDEIRIKDAVKLLRTLLNDEFVGHKPEPRAWVDLIRELIDTLYSSDIIIIAGLMKYEIIAYLDDFGFIEKLELEEQ